MIGAGLIGSLDIGLRGGAIALFLLIAVAALRRGVRVRIITPGEATDSKLVLWASRAHWGPILEKGGEINEYEPTNFHCKVFVVDWVWSSVGSTYFHARSF